MTETQIGILFAIVGVVFSVAYLYLFWRGVRSLDQLTEMLGRQ